MAKVLIVDDSKIMRSLVKAMVIKLGHEVVGEASNGLDGYDKYFELKPDLVTMDITMPVLDGVATLRRIKENDPDAKVIIITSNAHSNKLADIISSGASAYIFKPLNEAELEKTVNQVLN